jgi:hypothetical protein
MKGEGNDNGNFVWAVSVAGGSSQEGSLIDLSPEELANATAVQLENNSVCRRVVNILDEPNDVERVSATPSQEYWQEEDPRTYANCPENNGLHGSSVPDPFDTSRVFSNSSQSRYYSQVTPDLPMNSYFPSEANHQQQVIISNSYLCHPTNKCLYLTCLFNYTLVSIN